MERCLWKHVIKLFVKVKKLETGKMSIDWHAFTFNY